MQYRPILSEPEDQRLGRLIPDDWEHVDKYPLSSLSEDLIPKRVPVVIGVNWYREFDTPQKDNRFFGDYWIKGPLTRIRGGHCVCLEPGGYLDSYAWYNFYDQKNEGACVGFGWSRAMSILNRTRYSAWWLWDRAKEIDQWSDTNPGDSNGTSVRAAGKILAGKGHVPWVNTMTGHSVTARDGYSSKLSEGILKYRWATSVDDIHRVLGNPKADKLGALPILNSWGKGYPRRVWFPDSVIDRLMREDGEFSIPTDR